MKNLTYHPNKDKTRYAGLWVRLESPKLLEKKEMKE
jgi:hypothetical protein